MQKRNMRILIIIFLLTVSVILSAETEKEYKYPQFSFAADSSYTLKVENNGDVSNIFDELSFQ